MPYKEVFFKQVSADVKEIVIAQLSELEYEGFEETAEGLKAFIVDSAFDPADLSEVALQGGLEYSVQIIPDTNWNELWESNFHRVVVEDFCAVRADFHDPVHDVQHEILITPKMSFGTGHHPTTYMMMQLMKDIDFTGCSVLDFGTGTGVLAILAHKLGASSVVAIDNDDWSISNAQENISRNGASQVCVRKGDTADSGENVDIVLANIIKTVLLANFPAFQRYMKADGTLVLSGLLEDDERDIVEGAAAAGFTLKRKLHRESWISLQFGN